MSKPTSRKRRRRASIQLAPKTRGKLPRKIVAVASVCATARAAAHSTRSEANDKAIRSGAATLNGTKACYV